MYRLASTFLLTAVILLTSCHTYKEKRLAKKAKRGDSNIEVIEEIEPSKALDNNTLIDIIINKDYQWPGTTDAFNILEQKVVGDTLITTVEYGGGCQEHIFTMNTTSAWMKSMPPKLNLWLEHENNNDMCRALIREDLRFNLKPIRYSAAQSIIIIVNGAEEKSVLYRY